MAEHTLETSFVSFLGKFPDLFRQRADSLEEFNAVLNSEYTTLVEQPLLGLDYLPGILEKMQTLLAGQTLTAISLLTGVPEVDVIGTLDKVSTRRNAADAAVRGGFKLGKMLAHESTRRFGLPSYDNLALAVHENKSSVRKAVGESSEGNGERGGVALQNNFVKQLTEQEGLSTGKTFSVTFERNGNRQEYPMRLRLDVKSVPTDGIKTLIGFGEQTRTFWERYVREQYKGDRKGSLVDRLAAAKDVMLQNDLMDEYRKNRFRDKTGYYKKMMEKKNGNWLSGLLTFSPSVNNASGLMIVTQETIDSMTAELGGDFDDYNVRKRVFENTLTIYYVVVDQVWGKTTIYTRGQNGSMELDKSDFSKAKSGSGDVNKIIEAYRSGAQPVL